MNQAPRVVMTLIWEWPLRAWHWLFALCIGGSLVTGLSGDIGWMDWHLRFGYCACGLLLFRLLWGSTAAGGIIVPLPPAFCSTFAVPQSRAHIRHRVLRWYCCC
jgi:cytochrome b